MGYVDEVIERVIAKNPGEPEFHQAVKEVLESLRPVVEANEALYRREALLERITEPDRQIKFRVPWVDDKGQVQVNTGYRLTTRSDRTREDFACILLLILALSNFLVLSRFSRIPLQAFQSVAARAARISILRASPTVR